MAWLYFSGSDMKEDKLLKDLRNQRNLTQSELSELSGISIRTIQRMEKGLSLGSPYTINALAGALEVPADQLLVLKENHSTIPAPDVSKLRLLNFSILSVLIIPFGNIILPVLIFWLYKADQYVNRNGRKIIGFQVVVTFVVIFLTGFMFLILGRGNGAIPLPVFIVYALLGITNMIIVIRTSIEINQGKEVLDFFPHLL